MKKIFFMIFIIFNIIIYSINLGIYSKGIFLEIPNNNLYLKVGYPSFGINYNIDNEKISYNLITDFNLNNPQLNNYLSTNIGIVVGNTKIYSGVWNIFDELNSVDATTSNIGNMGFFTGITTDLNNIKISLALNLKVMNWIESGGIVTGFPAFRGSFEDAAFFLVGLSYFLPLDNNEIRFFINFGANYISFPNGMTLYQFKDNYNFGILITLNDLFNN
ncbi:hypothetical protein [Marinitoga sp. 38H-ov]|uniref:hypothetical protein n=1 Tax=Marinitoga sp. 38H-ov TaxID=1755814 RepID=UPI0013ECA99C|nr:hypothetical protein [Marinitoga sp. 38H-ov]KAF2955484.1 hypothetical protein AS160_09790 [Marinitoga sp. 38H-ov]